MNTEMNWTNNLEHLLNKPLETSNRPNYGVMMLNHCFDSPDLNYKLNETIFCNPRISKFAELWNAAKVRHLVDGGSNYLFDLQMYLNQNYASRQLSLEDPQIITGDFDSIRSDVLEYYRTKDNVIVQETPDQNETDFTKAIKCLTTDERLNVLENPIDSIIVFYTSTGRLDHVLSIFSTLYKFNNDQHSTEKRFPRIVLVDLATTISVLFSKGKNVIRSQLTPPGWCSIVPLNGPVMATTTGFRWNLNKQILEVGKLISTSQEFDGESIDIEVEVHSDIGLMFTINYVI
ncbi:cAMP-dependent protein kinase subunit [Blomia tropicalis]|nr:cAMP-dependent protein kinase subunit [Blomia tropicalis]